MQVLRDVSQQRVLPGAEPTMKLKLSSVPKALTPKQEKVLTPKQEKARDTPKQEKVRAPRPNRNPVPPEPNPTVSASTHTPKRTPLADSPIPSRLTSLAPAPPPCAGERRHAGLSARVQAGLHRSHTGRPHTSGPRHSQRDQGAPRGG